MTENRRYHPLSPEEVNESRHRYGQNQITLAKPKGFFYHYIRNFSDPIIRILLIALAIQLILLIVRGGSRMELFGVAFAVAISTLVSTVSEYGSEKTFRRMISESREIKARVQRQTGVSEIPMEDLCCGDLAVLSVGDLIPADGVLISGAVTVDQSAVNGESHDVAKHPDGQVYPLGRLSVGDPLSHPTALLRGTVVTGGSGTMAVLGVGDQTVYGSMMAELQGEVRQSPLKQRLTGLAKTLSRLGYGAAILVALSDLVSLLIRNGGITAVGAADFVSHLLHALTLGITVVVMAVPEGLPMMITVVLSSNMLRMSRDNVLVRRLVGIETAGCLNILFTDKTGTLTRGKPEMVSFCDGEGRSYPVISTMPEPLRRLLTQSSALNTECSYLPTVSGGNGTDRAILNFSLPINAPFLAGLTVRHKLPFDSRRKYSTVSLTESGGRVLSLVKGAPELILPYCTGCFSENGEAVPWQTREAAEKKLTELTKRAFRVVAIASSAQEIKESGAFPPLTFIGFCIIRDSLRRSAAKSVSRLRRAGIQVVMITGDNRETAYAIASECGIIRGEEAHDASACLTGGELAVMSDEELRRRLPSLRVVARAMPADKSRLVRLAQQNGLVSGMTGDGVNDAPALKTADVGFAMGSGTEAAKEAGDICIRDDNIASIVQAVLYGRTIFRSIRKFIVYQLTMNLCAVAVSVVGSFLGIETPITVVQMLWINLIMDTFAGLAFAGEAPKEQYLRQAPLSPSTPVLTRSMTVRILYLGLFTVAICLGFLCCPYFIEGFRVMPDERCFLTGFFTLFVLCGVWNAFNSRTDGVRLFSGIFRNPAFLPVMGIALMVQALIVCFGGNLFRCTPLALSEWRILLFLSLSVLPFDFFVRLFRALLRRK